ncbi:MAG TPA: polysaccharide deacetylase family protein [Anaerolineales bacterium]|nr:polysaccharide deacetylase family protein [Anaerolineales bacterium]
MAIVFLSGCAPASSASDALPTMAPTQRDQPSPTAPRITTPHPFPTPPPTASPTTALTPPSGFTTDQLRPGVEPQSYLTDACEYLRRRWDPERSAPGTVVQPIMYHSIREPARMLDDNVTVSTDYFQATVDDARALGFETVTTEELIGFLTENARIPPRSMMLIVDDRRPGVVGEVLLPVAEQFDWTVTLSWIIGDTGPDLWSFMENLAEGGRLDVQSHGLRHHYIVEGMPEDEIREEIAGSIPILEQHFGARPLAFVWPGGNFTPLSAQIAREEGYRLGFTAFSRGPLLFNWIPLGETERTIGDPLMVLPRAWSPSAIVNLQQAARIGDEAARQAQDDRTTEAQWYSSNCAAELPPS